MKVRFATLLTTGLLLALPILAGCSEYQTECQPRHQNVLTEGEINMDDTMMGQQLENQRPRHSERMRNDMSYIFVSDLDIAPRNVNLCTIERFVFSSGVPAGRSFNVVIDRMFGGVHHSDQLLIHRRLYRAPFSAEFIDDDLIRLIEAIENSNMRNWPEHHEGTIIPNTTGGPHFWRIGIEFSDGSVMRRSGSGDFEDHFPPQEQWDTFMGFINSFAQEIIERHNAENPQADE